MPAPSFGSRVASKASKIYDNRKRDLVDAAEADESSVEKVPADKLPEAMQKMSGPERKKYVAAKAAERKKIQQEIQKISKERQAFLAEKMKKLGESKDTFGDAICTAISEQFSR